MTNPAADELLELGYIVIEQALDRRSLRDIVSELEPVLDDTPLGRNEFEGHRTRRAYALLARMASVRQLAEHPTVLALADSVLLPRYLLSALLAIDLHPDETAQPWHYDDGFYLLPHPRPVVGLSTIWALDDFTEDNGATQVIPGSHRHAEDSLPDDRHAVAITMTAGSVLVFLGTLWHRGGENRSGSRRRAVTAQYCQPWARQQEQMVLAVPPEAARACSPHLQAMLGWSIHPPFMGHVAGTHPARALGSYAEHQMSSRRAATFWDRPPSETWHSADDVSPSSPGDTSSGPEADQA